MKNLKCLLIHTPRLHNKNGTITSEINYCAMGLFSLAGELVKNNFNAKIINLGIEKYLNKKFLLSNYIKENNIKLIAFSLHWNQTSYDVIETARIIKEKCPEVFITLGGYSASFFAEEILENFPFIDSIMKGEGELSIVKLAESIYENKSLKNVPNLYWRKNSKIILNKNIYVASSEDLNKFEFFNPNNMLHYKEYSKIPYILNYSENNQLTAISATQGICLGRGCLGNCIWCGGGYNSEKEVTGRTYLSYRSSRSVMSEIKNMKENYNINLFRFSFDPNPKDRKYLINLFNELAKEFKGELNVIYNMDGLPCKNFLDAFKQACTKDSRLVISPVCYNENLRKIYKSFYYTNSQLEEILDYIEKENIKTEIYFSNIPGINKEENEKSKEYGEYLKNKYKCISELNNYEMIIVPASPWTKEPQKYNLGSIPKTFLDYYNINKSFDESFEKSFY